MLVAYTLESYGADTCYIPVASVLQEPWLLKAYQKILRVFRLWRIIRFTLYAFHMPDSSWLRGLEYIFRLKDVN